MSTQSENTPSTDPTPEQPLPTRIETDANDSITGAELRHRRAWLALGFLADAGLITLPRLTDVRPSQMERAFLDLQYAYRELLGLFELIDGEEA